MLRRSKSSGRRRAAKWGVDPSSTYHAVTFGDPKFFDEIDEITELALQGQKQATSHLEIDFEVNNVPVRNEGDYWLMLDKSLKPPRDRSAHDRQDHALQRD